MQEKKFFSLQDGLLAHQVKLSMGIENNYLSTSSHFFPVKHPPRQCTYSVSCTTVHEESGTQSHGQCSQSTFFFLPTPFSVQTLHESSGGCPNLIPRQSLPEWSIPVSSPQGGLELRWMSLFRHFLRELSE